MPEQGSVEKFQIAIDALATLPVHGVVTVGDSVDPSALKPAQNVVVFATADHDDPMRRAARRRRMAGTAPSCAHSPKDYQWSSFPDSRLTSPSTPPLRKPGAGPLAAWQCYGGDDARSRPRSPSKPILSRGRERDLRAIPGIDGAKNAADEIEQLLSDSSKKASLKKHPRSHDPAVQRCMNRTSGGLRCAKSSWMADHPGRGGRRRPTVSPRPRLLGIVRNHEMSVFPLDCSHSKHKR